MIVKWIILNHIINNCFNYSILTAHVQKVELQNVEWSLWNIFDLKSPEGISFWHKLNIF